MRFDCTMPLVGAICDRPGFPVRFAAFRVAWERDPYAYILHSRTIEGSPFVGFADASPKGRDFPGRC